jgi:L-arabinose isomerase
MKKDVGPRIGLMAVGLAAYWPQFAGMRERLLDHHARLARLLEGRGEIVAAGLVDTASASRAAGSRFVRGEVDIVFCQLATYAASETLLPAIRALDVPVVLLNVQATRALELDRVTGIADWLGAGCTCAGLPEMTATLTGHLDHDEALAARIAEWCVAAGIGRRLRGESVALLGRPYAGMMDLYIDETRLFERLGVLTAHLDWDDVIAEMDALDEQGAAAHAADVAAVFGQPGNLTAADLASIGRALGGLRRLVARHGLSAIANHFEGPAHGRRADLLAALNPALSMLNGDGIACPVEGDIKVAIAMLILRPFAGSATLAELYSMDFDDDVCLIGHSGAGDPAISNQPPRLGVSDVFHGKTGRGFLTQFFPQPGPVTLLSFTQDAKGDFRMVAAQGEIVEGPTLGLGDTNSRVRFSVGLRNFVARWAALGPTHHAALGRGHHVDALATVATTLGIGLDVACR